MKTKRSASVTLVIFALLYPLLAFAQQTQQPTGQQYPPWDCSGPSHMWGGGSGFWWIFPLFMLLTMLIICGAIFFLGHKSGGGGHHHWGPWHMLDRSSGPGRPWSDSTHSALQILNERFAKGEIQKQEYDEKKTAILASSQ